MKDLLAALTPGDRDWRLAQEIDPERLPAHIAVIMDGNGRWARQRNFPRIMGHRAGVDAVRAVVETCAQLRIEALTLYAFSIENWKRPRPEVEALWRLLQHYLRRELSNLLKNDVRLIAIGRIDLLPDAVRSELQSVMEKTAHNRGLRLNLAINYGGRAEIVDAVNAIIERARAHGTLNSLVINEEELSSHLYTAGLRDPDLLIRTSGEMRVSNFLLWQIAYAELYVTDTLWPDFKRAELLAAILDYQSRERRFGNVGRNTLSTIEENSYLEEFEAPLR